MGLLFEMLDKGPSQNTNWSLVRNWQRVALSIYFVHRNEFYFMEASFLLIYLFNTVGPIRFSTKFARKRLMYFSYTQCWQQKII